MVDELENEVLPYTTINTDQAKQMIGAGAHVVDVRRHEEWNRGHIAEADLVTINGIYTFGKALQALGLSLDKDVIFVCAAGQRSMMASEIASLIGFKCVYNLANGMNGWAYCGYPVEH
jgi:rhodanese-related sulfurtransferase